MQDRIYFHPCNNSDIRRITAAFTGPRPEKLPAGLDWEKLWESLLHHIEQAIIDGYSLFYTGACRGIDMLAGRCVLSLKDKYPHVMLGCAVPFEGQSNRWPEQDRKEYISLLALADKTEILSAKGGYNAYYFRNQWMISQSSRLIAVYANSGGGTGHTVRCAEKAGLSIVRIDPNLFIRSP